MDAGVVAVAYSGGRDSTALLHATLSVAAPFGLVVVALHVHHGLSAHADDWLAHCAERCRRWRRRGRPVTLLSHRLDGRPAHGESVEAWARQGRYLALRAMALAVGADLVLLGHHRRDQAETFLLQALRGGGAESLAAMPREARRDGITWARPWLEQPREAIDAYVRRHRLQSVDDDSNADERFARNRLRARVWPALVAAFGDAETCLAAAARRSHEAAAVVTEIAATDLHRVASSTTLDLAAWRGLSPARRVSVLRAWLRRTVGPTSPGSLVRRLSTDLDEAPALAGGPVRRWPAPGGELRSRRGGLCFVPSQAAAVGVPRSLDLSRIGLHPLPDWRGAVDVAPATDGGIAIALAARLVVGPRRGGEQFQAGRGRPARSLKKQYQAADVPAWAREGPIFSSDGRSVFVAGLGVDARALAKPGETQVALRWLPDRDEPAD